MKKAILLAVLLPVFSVGAGNLSVENLTVSKDATVYGKLNVCGAPTSVPVFTNGLAGYWPFSGNANDLSGNNNHGMVVGNAVLTTDRFNAPNSAYQFNGNGYIRAPNSASLCIRKDVSVSVWIKTANQWHGVWGDIVQKGSMLTRSYELAIGCGDKTIWDDVTRGRENWSVKSKNSVTDAKWHHLVGTWDGQTAKLYVDGICERVEQCSSARIPSSEPLLIGYGGNPYYFSYFKGAIDDLQIYNRALSESEVLSLYNYSIISNVAAGTLNVSQISVSNGIVQTSESGTNVFMGKVGIGTGNPAEKLHVAGNMKVDGTNIVSALVLGGVMRTDWPSGAQGALVASNNLSDLPDKVAARANLGLGSAAISDASAFDQAGAAGTVNTALSTHMGDHNNPHQVTASQVGALTPNGDGSQLTGIAAAQVGALSTNGGVVNGPLYLIPQGDLVMGIYTNQTGQ